MRVHEIKNDDYGVLKLTQGGRKGGREGGREGEREGHLPVMYLMMVSGEVQSSKRTV